MTQKESLPTDRPVPPALAKAIGSHSAERRQALITHILGGTSADYLADWFKRAGTAVGATTIKTYRRSIA